MGHRPKASASPPELCANGRLYTLLPIDGSETLLKRCATNDEMYYKITASNQLTGVFNAIGTELANLHLSK